MIEVLIFAAIASIVFIYILIQGRLKGKRIMRETKSVSQERAEQIRVQLEEVEEQLKAAVDCIICFDLARQTHVPEVHFGFKLENPSRYDVFVKQIDWDIWITDRDKPVVSGSYMDIVLLEPLMVRDNIVICQSMDHVSARYVSQSKQSLITDCYVHAVVTCSVGQSTFQKKFMLRNIPYRIEEEAASNMFIDPTHLDPLTGLLNQRFLKENIQSVVDLLEQGRPVSFIMIDFDDFKRINDDFGHLVGDEVLRAISAKIRETVGIEGFSIRYGGDEFSVLLMNCPSEEAGRVAERIRSHVARCEVRTPKGPLAITVSIGHATLEKPADATVLIQKADDMLRASKRAGKNRVTSAA